MLRVLNHSKMAGVTDLFLSGNSSEIIVDFKKPIKIPSGHSGSLAVKSFQTWNSVPNVEQGRNNQMKLKYPGAQDWTLINIPTGAWEIVGLTKYIHNVLTGLIDSKTKNEKSPLTLEGSSATGKCTIVINEKGYGVNFNVDYSIAPLFGFKETDSFEKIGRYEAEQMVQITDISQFLFLCNVIEGSYYNEDLKPILYNVNVDTEPGYRFGREVNNLTYRKLTTNTITSLKVWVTNQKLIPVNLRDEELMITLSLKITLLD